MLVKRPCRTPVKRSVFLFNFLLLLFKQYVAQAGLDLTEIHLLLLLSVGTKGVYHTQPVCCAVLCSLCVCVLCVCVCVHAPTLHSACVGLRDPLWGGGFHLQLVQGLISALLWMGCTAPVSVPSHHGNVWLMDTCHHLWLLM